MNRREGEFIDFPWLYAAIVDINCPCACKPLPDAVQDTGIFSCHFLLAWNIGPCSGSEHKKIAIGAWIEQFAARLVEWIEAFVG